ncbi:MAG: hypothetical protein JO056_04260, partial [Alphaproteobacteria bacterium]|nr:hypothetical protein [Alphaproteobacteria bacterium]
RRTPWTLHSLHSFCAEQDCSDGEEPGGKLVLDSHGNLYGVTAFGGYAVGNGLAYELLPNKDKSQWTYKILRKFCEGSCGALSPVSGLIYAGDTSGAPYDGKAPLFGTTPFGGAQDKGVVYALTHGKAGWSENVLYSFCVKGSCADGQTPYSALVPGAAGDFYGTTLAGGATGNGTVFQLSSHGKDWKQTVLHSFCLEEGCADGASPTSAPILDSSGVLYGTTRNGGGSNSGVAYTLAPGKTGSYAVLQDFCLKAQCADGEMPIPSLALDSNGTLFGTTYAGGKHRTDAFGEGGGTLFALSDGKHRILHHFCAEEDCTDGEYPQASVTIDSAGHLFGVTAAGGDDLYHGVIFEYVP